MPQRVVRVTDDLGLNACLDHHPDNFAHQREDRPFSSSTFMQLKTIEKENGCEYKILITAKNHY